MRPLFFGPTKIPNLRAAAMTRLVKENTLRQNKKRSIFCAEPPIE